MFVARCDAAFVSLTGGGVGLVSTRSGFSVSSLDGEGGGLFLVAVVGELRVVGFGVLFSAQLGSSMDSPSGSASRWAEVSRCGGWVVIRPVCARGARAAALSVPTSMPMPSFAVVIGSDGHVSGFVPAAVPARVGRRETDRGGAQAWGGSSYGVGPDVGGVVTGWGGAC